MPILNPVLRPFLLMIALSLLRPWPRFDCGSCYDLCREIWLIDTRNVEKTLDDDCPTHEKIVFWRFHDRLWEMSSQADFFERQSAKTPSIFVIHGNLTSHDEAIVMGNNLATRINRVFHSRPGAKRRANQSQRCRLVIWSWAADRERLRFREDARLKAARSDRQGRLLAAFLQNMQKGSKITLLGFSFGAGIAAAAIAQLASHATSEQRRYVEQRTRNRFRVNLIMLAPAVDCHAFDVNQRFGHVGQYVEKILLLYSSNDLALHAYPFLHGFRGPRALGITGVSRGHLAKTQRHKWRQQDMRNQIGIKHLHVPYFQSRIFRRYLRQYCAGEKK